MQGSLGFLLLALSTTAFGATCAPEMDAWSWSRADGMVPATAELAGAPSPGLAAGTPLRARVGDAHSLDAVLARIARAECPEPVADAFAGYQKKTEFDNTPWRYETAPGEKFSAEGFDAWMKSRGIRVAKGRPVDTVDTATPLVAE